MGRYSVLSCPYTREHIYLPDDLLFPENAGSQLADPLAHGHMYRINSKIRRDGMTAQFTNDTGFTLGFRLNMQIIADALEEIDATHRHLCKNILR